MVSVPFGCFIMQPRCPSTARHIWSISPIEIATGPETADDIGPPQPNVAMATREHQRVALSTRMSFLQIDLLLIYHHRGIRETEPRMRFVRSRSLDRLAVYDRTIRESKTGHQPLTQTDQGTES